MRRCVLDCSCALDLVFEDEQSFAPLHEKLLHESYEYLVPSLWFIELGNGLASGLKRKRLTREKIADIINHIADWRVMEDRQTSTHALGHTLTLAIEHGLSLYDATYLELALRTKIPLATLDKALIKSANKSGAMLLE